MVRGCDNSWIEHLIGTLGRLRKVVWWMTTLPCMSVQSICWTQRSGLYSDSVVPTISFHFLSLQTWADAWTFHCGPRGCNRRSQLYEHLFCMFWASNYRPTTGHNLVRSDLDFLLNSTPFWCKNQFCSLKTKEVIKYFLTKNIFPTEPSI